MQGALGALGANSPISIGYANVVKNTDKVE